MFPKGWQFIDIHCSYRETIWPLLEYLYQWTDIIVQKAFHGISELRDILSMCHERKTLYKFMEICITIYSIPNRAVNYLRIVWNRNFIFSVQNYSLILLSMPCKVLNSLYEYFQLTNIAWLLLGIPLSFLNLSRKLLLIEIASVFFCLFGKEFDMFYNLLKWRIINVWGQLNGSFTFLKYFRLYT